MSTPVTKYIYFYNDTDLPIELHSLMKNVIRGIRIPPKSHVLAYSSVGEWYLQTMFHSDEDCQEWKIRGLHKYMGTQIGKFRSDPCILGNYAWMEWDDIFECVYSYNTTNEIEGQMTFRYKLVEMFHTESVGFPDPPKPPCHTMATN